MKVWDTTTRREVFSLHRHTKKVTGLTFSRDSRRLASVGDEGMVRLWDLTTGQEVLSLSGQPYGLGRVAFSPDGRRLAAGA